MGDPNLLRCAQLASWWVIETAGWRVVSFAATCAELLMHPACLV